VAYSGFRYSLTVGYKLTCVCRGILEETDNVDPSNKTENELYNVSLNCS